MKNKLWALFIAVLMLLSIASCTADAPNATDDSTEETEKNVSYTIYVGHGFDSFSDKRQENMEIRKNVNYEDASQLKFGFVSFEDISEKSKTEKTSVTVGGRTSDIPYSKSMQYSVPNTVFDRYRTEYVTCDIMRSNGKISFYSDLTPEIALAEGDLTGDEAVAIASDFCNDYFTSEIMADYTFEFTSVYESGVCCYHMVNYRRYVYGHKTEDTLTVGVNMKGEVCTVNAKSMSAFDGIETDITAENIQASINAAAEQFPDDFSQENSYITLGSDGKYYLLFYISSSGESVDMYININ